MNKIHKFKILILLAVALISQTAYYWWRNNGYKHDITLQKDAEITEKIRIVQTEHNGTAGIGPMTAYLRMDYDMTVNHKVVQRLMHDNELNSNVKNSSKKSTSNQPTDKAETTPNKSLEQDFHATCVGDKMGSDITEVHLGKQVLYMSAIKDFYSNFVYHKLGYHPNADLVLKNIDDCKHLFVREGTYFTTDCGRVFLSHVVRAKLTKHDCIICNSKPATPHDNAPCESFFSTYKSEVIRNPKLNIRTMDDLIKATTEFMFRYNYKRRQKGLNYMTPAEYRETENLKVRKERKTWDKS